MKTLNKSNNYETKEAKINSAILHFNDLNIIIFKDFAESGNIFKSFF